MLPVDLPIKSHHISNSRSFTDFETATGVLKKKKWKEDSNAEIILELSQSQKSANSASSGEITGEITFFLPT